MMEGASAVHIVTMSDPFHTITHSIVFINGFEWFYILELILHLIVEATIKEVYKVRICPDYNIPPILECV